MLNGTIKFTKMHGLGNDYVYIDCFQEVIPPKLDLRKLAIAIADRRFGVGGDGMVLITPSDIADCRMRMFNADGSEGRMCGNAIRCIGRYVYEEGHVRRHEISIETLSGVMRVRFVVEDGAVSAVSASLGRISFLSKDLPFIHSDESGLGAELQLDGRDLTVNCASIGNPHCVLFVSEITDSDVVNLGPRIEKHQAFPEGVNVEFVRIISRDTIEMRVWERGSGETFACGTGAAASFATAHKLGLVDNSGVVKLRGGDLTVVITPEWEVITTGDTARVFEGFYTIPSSVSLC
jgi:diaminopimelate epimerase